MTLRDLAPPLIAILRGLPAAEAPQIGAALIEAGIRALEVPLNSPDPLRSIEALARRFAGQAIVGAGTVLSAAEVSRVREAGGGMIVSPNCDPAVIARSRAAGMISLPGVFTATEAFAALAAGADGLKIFPASVLGPDGIKALRAVLPAGTLLYGVGGIGLQDIEAYRAGGCDGFGIGANLYRPGMAAEAVGCAARALVTAWAR